MDVMIDKYRGVLKELLRQPTHCFDAELSKVLPRKSGLYKIAEKEAQDKAIYIGKSKSLHRRIYGDHFMGDRIASTLKRKLIRDFGLKDEKEVKNYLNTRCTVQFIIIEEQSFLTGIEHFAVAVLSPKWND